MSTKSVSASLYRCSVIEFFYNQSSQVRNSSECWESVFVIAVQICDQAPGPDTGDGGGRPFMDCPLSPGRKLVTSLLNVQQFLSMEAMTAAWVDQIDELPLYDTESIGHAR